jgi:hypothetical protein
MMVTRLTAAAVASLSLVAVAYAQEGKPCPSGHICPVCSEDNGVRTCKVDRPAPPQATARTAPLDISPPSADTPAPPPPQQPVFQFGPFIIPLR